MKSPGIIRDDRADDDVGFTLKSFENGGKAKLLR